MKRQIGLSLSFNMLIEWNGAQWQAEIGGPFPTLHRPGLFGVGGEETEDGSASSKRI